MKLQTLCLPFSLATVPNSSLEDCNDIASVPPNILVCPGWSAGAALLNTRIENKNILVVY